MASMIHLGAYGWRHPLWQPQYYPEDLPSEWQLDYYLNEYRVILMPASYLQETDTPVRDELDEISRDDAEVLILLEKEKDTDRASIELPESLTGARLLSEAEPVAEMSSLELRRFTASNDDAQSTSSYWGCYLDRVLSPMECRELAEFLLAQPQEEVYLFMMAPGPAIENLDNLQTMQDLLV